MAATDDGTLVEAARAGDDRAFGQLFDAWYDRVHDLSRRIVHDDGIAGEVAQDVFLTAWTKLASLDDPDAFGGWILRIARNRSLNRLTKERRSVTMDDETMTTVTDASAPDHDPLDRLDQAGRIALVWDAAAALGERDASVLDLHLRHGLSAAELAEELGTTTNNAHQVLFTLRKRLGTSVRALVLWRAGHPTCTDLRQGLAAAGLTSFGAPMVKAIDRHVDGCATCSDDRADRLSPAALFAAAPIVAAPILLKANAASALEAAGVPMAGSTAGGASGAGASAGTGSSGSGAGGSGTAGSGAGGSGATGVGQTGALTSGASTIDPLDRSLYAEAPAASGGDSDHRLTSRKLLATAAIVGLIIIGAVIALATRSDDDQLATATTTSIPLADVTQPSSDVGLIPSITVDATVRGDTAPPATRPTTVDPTPAPTVATTAPPPPPVIDTFDATPTGSPCGDGEVLWGITWATTDATGATIGRTDGKGQPYEPDGKTSICAPYGTVFFLNADGPGGMVSATDGGDPPPATTTQPTIVIG